jgi:hypothetical protein
MTQMTFDNLDSTKPAIDAATLEIMRVRVESFMRDPVAAENLRQEVLRAAQDKAQIGDVFGIVMKVAAGVAAFI